MSRRTRRGSVAAPRSRPDRLPAVAFALAVLGLAASRILRRSKRSRSATGIASSPAEAGSNAAHTERAHGDPSWGPTAVRAEAGSNAEHTERAHGDPSWGPTAVRAEAGSNAAHTERVHGDPSWGWTAVIAVGMGFATIAIALSDTSAREGHWWAEPLYWLALALMFAIPSVRLLMPSASRRERVALLVLLGIGLYAVKLLDSPTAFTYTDELQQFRSLEDIERTHHLFAENPLVRSYPFYPALLAITNALSLLTGLHSFVCGMIVIGAARLIFVLGLYALFERITGSPRLAAVGTLVTMTNPNFTYFDAEFSYESLALPIAIAALLAVSRIPVVRGSPERDAAARSTSRSPGRSEARWSHGLARRYPTPTRSGWEIVAIALALGVVVTHHMTTYWLVAMLVGWAATVLVRRRSARGPGRVPEVALAVALAAGSWYAFVAARATANELWPTLSGAVGSVGDLIHGSTGGKQLFHASTGAAQPITEQLFGFASVLIALTLVAVGLWALWLRRHKVHRLGFVLAVLAALYAPSLVFRLTQAGSETSNRASEFVFLGIGFLAALALGTALPGRTGRVLSIGARWPVIWVASCALFIGGITIGWAPYARQPGKYLVSAASRSVERQGVLAAQWAGAWLPADSRIATDGTNRLLMGSYGHLDPQGGTIDGVPVPDLFLSMRFGPEQLRVITGDKLRYVVADQRLTELPSQTGTLFERGEPSAYRRHGSLPAATMNKFDGVPGLDRIFDSGAIRIYNSEALLH